MICDVCNTDLKEEDGKSIVAKQVGLYGAVADSKQGKRVKELFGKTDFCVCYVCYLKSLGIRWKERPLKVPESLREPVCVTPGELSSKRKAESKVNGRQTETVSS